MHKPVMANMVQVIFPQTPVAWKLQEKLVGQGWFVPGIVQGGVGPQQVVLLCTALLPVVRVSGFVSKSALEGLRVKGGS